MGTFGKMGLKVGVENIAGTMGCEDEAGKDEKGDVNGTPDCVDDANSIVLMIVFC